MGIDLNQFVERVDDELQCSICADALENPVQLKQCEHAFCAQCIDQWFASNNRTCPIDRRNVSENDINRSPRFIINMIGRLKIKCNYYANGCESTLSFESLAKHVAECNFKPVKEELCETGCGKMLDEREKRIMFVLFCFNLKMKT